MSSSEEPDPMAQHFLECELCETRPAQHFCNTCPGNLCDICKEDHKRKKIFQNHEIIPLVSSRTLTTSFCADHTTKRCELHCKLCNQPVCSECIAENHKGHIMEKLSSYREEQREMLMQYIDRIEKTVIPAHENLLTATKTSHAKVIKSAAEVSTSVYAQTENIIRAVKSTESTILSLLEKSENHALSSIQSDQTNITERLTRLNEIKKTLQEMLHSKSLDGNLLKKQISNIKELETLPEVTIVMLSKFVPVKSDKALIRHHMGHFTSFGLSKTLRSRVDELSDPPRLVRSDRQLIMKPLRKAKLTVDVEKQYEIRCMNTNTSVVSGNDNKIRIVDTSGKVTKITTNLLQDRYPTGIDLTKDNDIIYIDCINRKVMRVTLNGDISTLFTLHTDYFPLKLFVTNSGNILISLALKVDPKDEGQRGKVVEYTTSGQIVKEFIKDSGKELFKRPQYVAKNPVNDDILISHYRPDNVMVLNGMGNLRFEYDGKALSKSDEFWPKQIICDSLNQILIADQYSYCIHVISQDGDPFALLLAGELSRPMGICFDRVDSIWISELESQKIKIFKYLE